jgi:uncharacterized protein (DUF58 family)
MTKPGIVARAWQRWRTALEESVRQQITLTGVLFTALMTMVGIAAFASANNLLFLLFAALMATMLVSGLVSRLGLAGLELGLHLPEHIAARQKVLGRVSVRNSKFTPSFSIHLRGSESSGLTSEIYFPILAARSRTEEPAEIEFAHRGIHKDNDFEFHSRFPFGFTERRAAVRLERELIVYPSIEPQPGFEELLERVAGEVEIWHRGRGHDFYRIRPYELNESARHVDWKASAHTGDLQVREFAKEEDQRLILFLDLNVPLASLPLFDAAVDCTAFLVWRLAERQTKVRFLTQNFDRTVPDNADAYAILRYLALVEPSPAAPPPAPDADRYVYLAISADPPRLADTGWIGDRILPFDRLAAPVPDDGRAG